jgi:predicted glycogen debranching enzyme
VSEVPQHRIRDGVSVLGRIGFGEEKAVLNRQSEDAWPVINTYGELSAVEWIHTNGAGAYAMSTVPMMHTRRYHGILVAPLVPPLGRYVMLSHLEMTLHVNGKQHRLSTHQFPGLAPTPGYRLLRRFSLDPIPNWNYRIGEWEFERDLCLARRRNICVMRFTWRGEEPATLYLRPLMPLRSIHELMHEHGAMVQRVALRQREVEIQPNVDLPPLCFRHSGVFVGSPDWWRRLEYLEDRTRAAEFQEDMWTPGTFELALLPGRPQYLVTAVAALPSESAQDLVEETCAELRALDLGSARPISVRRLTIAAEAFRVQSPDCASIIAGYPWFGVHFVPALASLAGLCIVPDQIEFAKRALACMTRLQHSGLLPDLITEVASERGDCSPTATLFLFEAVRALVERVKESDEFVRNVAYPALVRAFVRLRSSRGRRLIWLTSEGLLANGSDDRPLTWMNGQVGNWIVTPRRGVAIELQALWTRGCETIERLANAYGHSKLAQVARTTGDTARAAFKRRFWCTDSDYPYDCVSEGREREGDWADASVRPNALLALATDPSLFERWQAEAILAKVKHDLLTPRGIRTLAPQDKAYQGYHEGGLEEREGSAHQGTAWPHLIGYYVRAHVNLAPEDETLRRELRQLVEGAIKDPLALLQVPEMADGDAPNQYRASLAYSWAVAELLRAIVEDLGY